MRFPAYRTQYNHPPRKWQFWALYVGILMVVVLPFGAIFIFADITQNVYAPTFLIGALWYLWHSHHKILSIMVLYEDIGIDKGEDVTEQHIMPPPVLDEVMLQLEMDGFTRFCEIESSVGLETSPSVVWGLLDDTETVLALTSVAGNTAHLHLQSYGTEGGIFTDHNLRMIRVDNPHGEIRGTLTSLPDTIDYHRGRVSSRFATGAIKLETLEQIDTLYRQHLDVYRTLFRKSLRLQTLTQLMYSTVSATILLLVGWWVGYIAIAYPVLISCLILSWLFWLGVSRFASQISEPYIIEEKAKKKKPQYPEDGRHPLLFDDDSV
ncbi:MAG: hypothetical protein AAFQ07_09725 [Chloroflexota bacterium]